MATDNVVAGEFCCCVNTQHHGVCNVVSLTLWLCTAAPQVRSGLPACTRQRVQIMCQSGAHECACVILI